MAGNYPRPDSGKWDVQEGVINRKINPKHEKSGKVVRTVTLSQKHARFIMNNLIIIVNNNFIIYIEVYYESRD